MVSRPAFPSTGNDDREPQGNLGVSKSPVVVAVTISILALCLLSIPQKMAIGANPFALKGFIVPAGFGLIAGLTIGLLFVRNKQAYLKQSLLEKQNHEELVASEERFRLLAENARDVIFVWSLNSHRYEYLSPSAYNLTGHLPEEFYVNPGLYQSIVHPDDREKISSLGLKLRQGELPPFLEYRLRHRDGQTVWINQRHTVQLDPEGVPKALEGICTDVTAFRQEHLEKTGLQQQLQQSQKIEAIGRLAGGIAHDFNNLLTVINGYADLLLATEGKVQDHILEIREIRKAGGKAADLTHQLLSFSRNQASSPRPIDPGILVEQSLQLNQRMMGSNIRIVLDIQDRLPSVFLDPNHLDQILINLLLNARDAIRKSGTIDIRLEKVNKSGESCSKCHEPLKGDFLVLSVTDDGCGISSDNLDRVFDPFFTTKEVGQGTGLGLSTVYGIIHQVQGHLQVVSQVDRGTTFSIILPIWNGEEPPAPLKENDLPATNGQGETILIVEDEALVRSLASTVLQQHGYNIHLADNGDSALRIFEELDHQFDLILTDIVMPGIDGIELANKIRRRKPEIPILFMSGYLDQVLDLQRMMGNVPPILSKPFGAEELVRRIKQVLEEGD